MFKNKLIKCISAAMAVIMLTAVPVFAAGSGAAIDEKSAVIQYVKSNNIMQGDNKGNFNLTANVKRSDMALMLTRAFAFTTAPTSNFSDVPAGSYYYNAVGALKALGIAKGDGVNYHPLNNVTLNEVILFVERSANTAGSDVVLGDATKLASLFPGRTMTGYATRSDIAVMLYYILTGVNPTDEQTTDSEMITYNVAADEAIVFNGQDFVTYGSGISDQEVSYVKFSLPSKLDGILYYKYGTPGNKPVSDDVKYYANDLPGIANISFKPTRKFSGLLAVPYKAYSASGEYLFSSAVLIRMGDIGKSLDLITYSTAKGTAVKLNVDDFTADAAKVTNETLSYVMFTLPSGKEGFLYFNYGSPSNTPVSDENKYYVSRAPKLASVSMAPARTCTWTVYITYKAYNNYNKYMYTGTIQFLIDT